MCVHGAFGIHHRGLSSVTDKKNYGSHCAQCTHYARIHVYREDKRGGEDKFKWGKNCWKVKKVQSDHGEIWWMEFNVRTSQEEAFSKTVADAKIKINYEVFSLG